MTKFKVIATAYASSLQDQLNKFAEEYEIVKWEFSGSNNEGLAVVIEYKD